jgi:hypothetical protein
MSNPVAMAAVSFVPKTQRGRGVARAAKSTKEMLANSVAGEKTLTAVTEDEYVRQVRRLFSVARTPRIA